METAKHPQQIRARIRVPVFVCLLCTKGALAVEEKETRERVLTVVAPMDASSLSLEYRVLDLRDDRDDFMRELNEGPLDEE
mmetsp:Transcript_12151/g.17820  ORF Transcript_12151/g.17820 Transcript_12151/m.17820 type:complete len:81 (+) Transcript_12151:2717-2959(+)